MKNPQEAIALFSEYYLSKTARDLRAFYWREIFGNDARGGVRGVV